jgi:hypothetical protein
MSTAPSHLDSNSNLNSRIDLLQRPGWLRIFPDELLITLVPGTGSGTIKMNEGRATVLRTWHFR